jgi:WD40 repeat protein
VRSEPAQVPDSPWAPVIQRAVARDRERRQNSAHTLIRELEDVTLRVEGAEDLHPYPGLASFTEDDAEYFFGREAEVEQMWRKLEGPPRMFAIMGPSGAGKTSFIAAGLAANAPPGWAILRCTPGNTAFASLRSALTPELTHRPEILQALVADPDNADIIVDAVAGWRDGNTGALLVVDQFEELFTLNSKDDQRNFTSLLGRLPLENDVHILLSVRDDFAAVCNEHRALQPVFHELTVLNPPTGGNLRRAVVQPATKCGYRFEDDELVEEMLAEVEGERGALPTLAFAAARLWEMRDREAGLLTREAYHDIGGVGGALAQHAEATIDRIGTKRIAIVRELFRNLVTAEGTRAVREWGGLLSIFDNTSVGAGPVPPSSRQQHRPKKGGTGAAPTGVDPNCVVGAGFIAARESAEEVLRELIDARLLTSYEVKEEDRDPTRRVEIVHESLLANWPRLVRWRTQDQEGAQLRDELRQAAHTWDERGRHDDRLWSGTAYREYQLWRERYTGALTEVEEAFTAAMTVLATRRKRRRRLAATAAVVVFAVIAIIFAGLWQRSVRESRRAEAAKLIALGELELDTYPTASLAWATASLELADSREGRLMALRALAEGPPVTVCPVRSEEGFAIYRSFDIDPTGQWIASGESKVEIRHRNGSAPRTIWERPDGQRGIRKKFASSEVLLTCTQDGCLRWSVTSPGDPPLTEKLPGILQAIRGDTLFSCSEGQGQETIHRKPLSGGPTEVIGSMDPWRWRASSISADGSMLVYPRDTDILVRSLDDWSTAPTVIGTQTKKIINLEFLPDGRTIAASDFDGVVRLWPVEAGSAHLLPSPKGGGHIFTVDPTGRHLAASTEGRPGPSTDIWDLRAPKGTLPITVRRSDEDIQNTMIFHPQGKWLITGNYGSLGFWPLGHEYPWALGHPGRVFSIDFTPDGRWLLTITTDEQGDLKGRMRAWPLAGQNSGRARVLAETGPLEFFGADLEIDPSGRLAATGTRSGKVLLVPIGDGPIRELTGYSESTADDAWLAFSPSGRLLASAPGLGAVDQKVVRVWDLESGESKVVGEVLGVSGHLRFIDEDHLLWTGINHNEPEPAGGERVFNLVDGSVEILEETGNDFYRSVSPNEDFMINTVSAGNIFNNETELWLTDLESGERRWLRDYGGHTFATDIHPTGDWIVAGDAQDGTIRAGSNTGKAPHLLLGHEDCATMVVFSPDGEWIASASIDGTVRLWPMPDLSKPPLHTLPREELIARLQTLTNLRVVRDEESSTGWKVEYAPFPGWETVPTW